MASAFFATKQFPKVDITVYDVNSAPGVGQGASCAPVTLLHPFTPKGKVIWKGLEGFEEMLNIMAETEYDRSHDNEHRPLTRIIRPFNDMKRFNAYQRQLEKYPHVRQQ